MIIQATARMTAVTVMTTTINFLKYTIEWKFYI